jgi:hypothetical protein
VNEFHINPAAQGGGESVAGATCAEAGAACVRDAKERLGDNDMTRAITTFVVANANEGWRIFAAHTRELAVQKT